MGKPKLHELLAVEGDLEGIFKKIIEETKVNFTKHPDRYFGFHQRVEFFDELAQKEADTHKKLDDTVPDKLNYTAGLIVRYLDATLQKEKTNQEAKADIVIDGVVLATDLPATFLLGLEKKLVKVREIYSSIPTLQPGVKWNEDNSEGIDIFKQEHAEEKFRTKKVMKNHVVAEATKEHKAQVTTYTEDVKMARVIRDVWCGMISSSQKSSYLGRVDKLIRAVKKARQRANTQEVIKATVGKELFDYINGK